jgi:hypothetical protein
MNQSDQEHFSAILNNWCPKGPPFDTEPREVRLMRAFMQVSAYAADAARVLSKRPPIIDLDLYPNPLEGFEVIPPRVKVKRENLTPGLDEESKTSYAFENMAMALNLEKREKLALAVAEAIQAGYEEALDIDSFESNQLFRSKHTRWFTDTHDDDIKKIIKKVGPRLSFDQIANIKTVVGLYVNSRDRKKNMLKEALLES